MFEDAGRVFDGARDPVSLTRAYEAEWAVVCDALTRASGEQLARVLDYRGVLRMPALGFIQLATSHTIHHRGQLSVYLRELGVSVPAIYG